MWVSNSKLPAKFETEEVACRVRSPGTAISLDGALSVAACNLSDPYALQKAEQTGQLQIGLKCLPALVQSTVVGGIGHSSTMSNVGIMLVSGW